MTQTIVRGVKEMVEEANAVVDVMSLEDARAAHGNEDYVFIDVRDHRELKRDGKIPGAFSCPRGMLEFWIDPNSPYHKDIFAQDKTFVFYCASAWRSALATKVAQEMGLAPVCHLDGGFGAWKKSGADIEVLS